MYKAYIMSDIPDLINIDAGYRYDDDQFEVSADYILNDYNDVTNLFNNIILTVEDF